MIELNSWESRLVNQIDKTEKDKYQITFTNEEKHDERSNWTFDFLSNISRKISTVYYDPINVTLTIDNTTYHISKIADYDLPEGKVLIDATSLAFPEILHLFKLLNDKSLDFDVIYVQPTDYTESSDTGLDKVKTFSLSDDGLGVQQLPPFVGYTPNTKLFITLGFEGHRFGAMINSEEHDTSDIACLIGAPPFRLGWENKTLSNNYSQLIEIYNTSSCQFWFAGANDPIKTYEILETVHKSCTYQKKNLSLAPFGTKPAAIAAAQYAINHSGIVLLYDFVLKRKKRSSGTDLVHIWEFLT